MNLNSLYRPQKFSEVTGQEHITITLKQQLLLSKIAHAYIFCGPRGVGKTTMARILAQALNCPERKPSLPEPCNSCISCQEIQTGNSIHVFEIDAASHTGVDNVRENIIAASRVATSPDKYKVYILDEVHMLSTSAFNALLKTLEEPPTRTVFILATTEVHKLPPTILSRCQRFDFRRISSELIRERLKYVAQHEKKNVDEEVIGAVAIASDGFLRDALTMFEKILALDDQHITMKHASLVLPRNYQQHIFELIGFLLQRDRVKSIQYVKFMQEEGVYLEDFYFQMMEIMRSLLLMSVSDGLVDASIFSESETSRIRTWLSENDKERFQRMLEVCMTRYPTFKSFESREWPLELAILDICLVNDAVKIVQKSPSVSSKTERPLPEIVFEMKSESSIPVKAVSKAQNIERKLVSKDLTRDLSLEIFMAKWPAILDMLATTYHSLALLLRGAKVVSLEAGIVHLGFEFSLHEDQLKKSENVYKVETCIYDLAGWKVCLKTSLHKFEGTEKPVISEKKEKSDPMLNDLLDTFGGKIVS